MSDISRIYSFINQKILKGSFQDTFDTNRDGVILKAEYTDVMYANENKWNGVQRQYRDLVDDFWASMDINTKQGEIKGTNFHNFNALNANETNRAQKLLEAYDVITDKVKTELGDLNTYGVDILGSIINKIIAEIGNIEKLSSEDIENIDVSKHLDEDLVKKAVIDCALDFAAAYIKEKNIKLDLSKFSDLIISAAANADYSSATSFQEIINTARDAVIAKVDALNESMKNGEIIWDDNEEMSDYNRNNIFKALNEIDLVIKARKVAEELGFGKEVDNILNNYIDENNFTKESDYKDNFLKSNYADRLELLINMQGLIDLKDSASKTSENESQETSKSESQETSKNESQETSKNESQETSESESQETSESESQETSEKGSGGSGGGGGHGAGGAYEFEIPDNSNLYQRPGDMNGNGKLDKYENNSNNLEYLRDTTSKSLTPERMSAPAPSATTTATTVNTSLVHFNDNSLNSFELNEELTIFAPVSWGEDSATSAPTAAPTTDNEIYDSDLIKALKGYNFTDEEIKYLVENDTNISAYKAIITEASKKVLLGELSKEKFLSYIAAQVNANKTEILKDMKPEDPEGPENPEPNKVKTKEDLPKINNIETGKTSHEIDVVKQTAKECLRKRLEDYKYELLAKEGIDKTAVETSIANVETKYIGYIDEIEDKVGGLIGKYTGTHYQQYTRSEEKNLFEDGVSSTKALTFFETALREQKNYAITINGDLLRQEIFEEYRRNAKSNN